MIQQDNNSKSAVPIFSIEHIEITDFHKIVAKCRTFPFTIFFAKGPGGPPPRPHRERPTRHRSCPAHQLLDLGTKDNEAMAMPRSSLIFISSLKRQWWDDASLLLMILADYLILADSMRPFWRWWPNKKTQQSILDYRLNILMLPLWWL